MSQLKSSARGARWWTQRTTSAKRSSRVTPTSRTVCQSPLQMSCRSPQSRRTVVLQHRHRPAQHAQFFFLLEQEREEDGVERIPGRFEGARSGVVLHPLEQLIEHLLVFAPQGAPGLV